MTGTIKISVVIPTWKRPHLLARCLQHLSRQSFPSGSYEVVVVTDGPDEETLGVYAELADSSVLLVRCYTLPQKEGPAAARNFGWQHAQGELIVFTDDDCLPTEDMLTVFWQAYRAHQRQCIVFTGGVVVPVDENPTDYERNTARLETAEFVTANCACPLQRLQQVGGFDEEFKAAWREDSDLHFKLLERGIPIRKLERAVVVHPARKVRWGVSLAEQKKSMYNPLLYKKHPKLFRERIYSTPNFWYYGMVISGVGAILAALTGAWPLAVSFFVVWWVLTASFARKRLLHTSNSVSHVAEMLITSAIIPFLSLYWTWYGAFRYRTWFL